MPLTQMAPGGQWLKPPFEGPAVYLGPKQHEAHFKRLVGDGWTLCDDPRQEGDQPQVVATTPINEAVALQARIDQLEAMVRQLLAANQPKEESAEPVTPTEEAKPKRGK